MVTVLLTQPQPRVVAAAAQLQAAGLQPVMLTFTRLEALPTAATELASLDPAQFQRIVFVSPSAVWFARDRLQDICTACPDGLAVIGTGTEAALRAQVPGIRVKRPAQPPYDAASLMALPAMQAPAAKTVLVIRGEQGRQDWINACRATGTSIRVLSLYRQQPVQPDPGALRAVSALASTDQKALIMVTSVGLAARLIDWPVDDVCFRWLRQQPCMVSHPRISERLRAGGFGQPLLGNSDVSLLDAAIQWGQNQ